MMQRNNLIKKASLLFFVVAFSLLLYNKLQEIDERVAAQPNSSDKPEVKTPDVSSVAPEQLEPVVDTAQGIEICDSSGQVYVVDYPFNFPHAKSANGVGPWMQQLILSLKANNLEWPQRSIETDDSILNNNLSKREAQMIGWIQSDPHKAVELMQTFIEQEESKFMTRELMSGLHDSIDQNNGVPSNAAYAETLAGISDRYFAQVVQLGLQKQQQLGLGRTAFEHALQRDEAIKVKSLAHLIESPNVANAIKEEAATELADALSIDYSPDQLNRINWNALVDTYLARLN